MIMMKKIGTVHIAYGAALILAAATGAMAIQPSDAHAKAKTVKAKPTKAVPTTPRVALATTTTAAVKPAATGGVTLNSTAMIERVSLDAKGVSKTVLKTPSQAVVVPGDKVIFTISYANLGREPASGFRATNPMPAAVHFFSVNEEWAEVSVDGGQLWGKLDALTVPVAASPTMPASTRGATAEDVTHVRWVFATPIAPGAKGSVSYRGVVK
jgi:uncharacterized repeat protein (TIGR01451 family)